MADDFLSMYLGLPPPDERTAWLRRQDAKLNDTLDYYFGPSGVPDKLRSAANLAYFTDAGDMAEAADASREIWNDPSLANTGRYLTAAAALAIPAVSARGMGVFSDAADSAVDDIARYLGDESGAIAARISDPVSARGAGILELLTSGRASEVTDEMLDMGDPVANANLSQYLWDHYDLPMDEASRMARADEFWPSDGLHGSTHIFDKFGDGRHSPEGYFGGGNYFSDSTTDVSRNYAGVGPDLTNRIQLRAEQLASEMDVPYDDPSAVAQATAELRGPTDGVIYPVRYSPGNQFDVSSNRYVASDQPELNVADFLDEAGGDADLAEELAIEARYETEPTGPLADFIQALTRDPRVSDASAIVDALSEYVYAGGVPMSRLDKIMRETEWWAEDDFGNFATTDVYANALRAAGYDTFAHPADVFKGMGNMGGTTHTIIPDPSRIRSRFARFDPRLAHLRNLSAGLAVGGLPLSYYLMRDDDARNPV